jgi:hypothetical protein
MELFKNQAKSLVSSEPMASKKGKPLVFSMNPKYHLHLLAAM